MHLKDVECSRNVPNGDAPGGPQSHSEAELGARKLGDAGDGGGTGSTSSTRAKSPSVAREARRGGAECLDCLLDMICALTDLEDFAR